jgi:hypothetical protein
MGIDIKKNFSLRTHRKGREVCATPSQKASADEQAVQPLTLQQLVSAIAYFSRLLLTGSAPDGTCGIFSILFQKILSY